MKNLKKILTTLLVFSSLVSFGASVASFASYKNFISTGDRVYSFNVKLVEDAKILSITYRKDLDDYEVEIFIPENNERYKAYLIEEQGSLNLYYLLRGIDHIEDCLYVPFLIDGKNVKIVEDISMHCTEPY